MLSVVSRWLKVHFAYQKASRFYTLFGCFFAHLSLNEQIFTIKFCDFKRPSIYKILFTLLGIAFSTFQIRADETDIPLRDEVLTTWTTEQGLPQNFVTSLAQTPDGFLWVGTMSGLMRFDGLHFRGFSAGWST